MRCHHCGHRFSANYQAECSPGGQEAPGLFFIIGGIFLASGIALHVLVGTFWQWFCYAVSAFVWLQCLVALTDCWRVACPDCGQRTRVMPWSF